IVSYALPDNTACVHTALTEFAPFSIIKAAALERVPAVSQISSIKTTSCPVTSPIIDIDSISLARLRRLSQMMTSALKNLANVLARYDPPMSGEAIVKFGKFNDLI